MTKKKVKDDEQKELSKRSVKQASRKVISTSTAQSSGARSSAAKSATGSTGETQASRSKRNIRQGNQNTATVKTTTSKPSSMEKPQLESMIPVPFGTRATRSDKLDKKLASTTTTPKIEQKTRGLAFPSNHFQTTSTAKSTNGSKTKNTLMPGESLLKPVSSFPSSAQSRMTTLSHTNAQDSLVSMPTQAKRRETLPTTFGTQTVRSKKDTAQAASVFKTPEEWTQDVWTAVKRGDRQLAYASNLEKELEDKYGSLDYAKYIPEHKGLVTAIHQAQMEYQKQREFIEKNYRQLPLLPAQTTNHTNADRWYYEERLRQIREEMASYDEMCGGRMDLASLRSYYEQINLYESILATKPNTKGEQYMDDTFEQVLKGNYTDKVTALGTAFQVGLAFSGLDFPMDIRDAAYDWTHLRTTPWWQTTIDTISVLPVAGVIKLLEDVVNLKRAGKVIDTVSTTAKRAEAVTSLDKLADDTIEVTKHLDDAADTVKQSEYAAEAGTRISKSTENQALDLSFEKKYNEAKEAYAAAANANEAVTYYRVQGGSSSRSKYLLVVNPDGTMQVNNTGNLSLSAYTTDHMHYFSKKRGENTEVVSFEVPRWFDDFVRETAILQEKYTMNPLNQGRSAPKMTDLTKPGFTYEFPPIWNEWLAEYAFNAKVVKGGLP